MLQPKKLGKKNKLRGKKARAIAKTRQTRNMTFKNNNYSTFINKLIVASDLESVKNNRDN